MVGDPIGDFIIQLKNASAVKKEVVALPYSKMKHAVADALAKEGYVKAVEKRGKKVKKTLEVTMAYDETGMPAIRGVLRVSKPGRRMYANVGEIHPVKYGKGKLILSTPAGILTGENARKQNVGGEQLFKIW